MKTKDIKKVSSLNYVERDSIISCSGIERDKNTICLHHKYIYLKRYSTIHKTCCDPFNSHNEKKKEKVLIINHETFFKVYCNYR